MNIAPVAYRYARSLMQLAIEQGQLAAVQLEAFLEAVAKARKAREEAA